MNKYALILASGIMITLSACKKEKNAAITGSWQETKLRVYVQDATGTILSDTTYLRRAFTNLDYVQFNSNGKCVIAADHIYYSSEPAFPKTPKDSLITANYSYTTFGAVFIIQNQQNIPVLNGLTLDTVTTTNPNTLLIHSVFRPFTMSAIALPPPRTISDAYYTR